MKRFISLFLTLTAVVSFCVLSVPMVSAESGVTYYVDSAAGSDSNDGTSSTSAWKTLEKVNSVKLEAGNKVLFKKGCTFQGTLAPQGRGAKGQEITISAYGDGAKPLIDAAAVDANYGVYISSSYYIVDGLAVQNRNGNRERAGIKVLGGTNIVIKNCDVSGVEGDVSDRIDNRNSYSGMTGISADKTFNVTIENNTITNVIGSGIVTAGEYRAEAKGFVIQNNTLNDIGKDGILVNNAIDALVQYNVVNNSHNYSTAYHVAIWPFASDNTLLQYNEAYNTKTTKDGHGFDCDYYSKGTIFQYNYGHDNEGGFMLICCEPDGWAGEPFNEDCIVRYNIGQNNKTVQFMLVGQISNTKIYNNTLYYTKGATVSMYVRNVANNPEKAPKNTQFYNNIFYNVNGGHYNLLYTEGGATAYATGTVWENNCFYGEHPVTEPNDPYKITKDPLLLDEGGASVGLESCSAYQLHTNSPLIGAGRIVLDNGGKDFFGNTVAQYSKPNIGAYNGLGVGIGVSKDAEVKKPAKVTIKKVTSPKKKQIKVTWKKIKKVTGYKIQYSTKRNFKSKKTITVKGAAKTSRLIKKLKSKKKYFVRVRAYKNANGKTLLGKFSKIKSVKVK